ncbi:DUF6630 family protein [Mucilaginibacter sp. FT3.2]|uniref:DUF6630 family protein n=1 Tax=Mucilaginibacter sp. FT3.2 TaxID=2723090 RepID=UPI00161DE268|nr:hypothetical protein [Mucilaginibacter sp. FT3.2]MBB6234850.1 hypothetical protein [Mucilaginibacter sp. FT3.2]
MKKITLKDKLLITGIVSIPIIAIVLAITTYSLIFRSSGSTTLSIVVLVFIIVFALVFEVLKKKKDRKEKANFWEIGEMTFPAYREEFCDFYKSYLGGPKMFVTRHARLLKDADSFAPKKLKPIDIFYLFADSKKLVKVVDWRGEENKGEIEEFIDQLLTRENTWTNVSKLRVCLNAENRSGNFIVDLFKAVDIDLKVIGRRLVFFELGGDAYVYTVIDSKTASQVIKQSGGALYGVEKLH